MRWGRTILLSGLAIAVALGATGLVMSRDQLRKAKSDIVALTNRLDQLKPASGHEHSEVRQWMIRQELRRVGPVVVIGDSHTEAAPLPKTVCGHAIVNAGIGGANVAFAAKSISTLLSSTTPALIVLAIGTNDAHPLPEGDARFAETYRSLLEEAASLSPRLAAVTIPSMTIDGPLTRSGGFDPALISDLNATIEQLAAKHGATLIHVRDAIDQADLPSSTIDGVHLSTQAYDIWVASVLRGMRKALACEPMTDAGRSSLN